MESFSTNAPRAQQPSNEAVLPTLPPNVSIYTGPSGTQLLHAKVFTRLATTAQDPAKLAAALGSDCTAFCHQHQKTVLIFDEELETHHEHFRQVCLRLKEYDDTGVEFGRCVFDARTALQAGFQMDELKGGDVLVVDLQDYDEGKDDDEAEDEDEEDDGSVLEALGKAIGVTPNSL